MPRDISKRANRVTQPRAQSSQRMTFEELLATAGHVGLYRNYHNALEVEKEFGIKEDHRVDPDGEYNYWMENLLPDWLQGIANYTGDLRKQMDEALKNNDFSDPYIREQIENAQNALLQAEILNGITVFKDSGFEMFGGLTTAADIEAAFKGKVTLERAFLTSKVASNSQNANLPLRVAIHYAPGTHGQYVEPISQWKGRQEFIGAAGQHWVLNFAKEQNGRVYADITVLPESAVNQYTQGTGSRDAQARGAYYKQKKA